MNDNMETRPKNEKELKSRLKTDKFTKKSLREEMCSLFQERKLESIPEEEEKDVLKEMFSPRRVEYDGFSICSECGHLILEGAERAHECPRCEAELSGTVTHKDFSGNEYLLTRYAAKYDTLTNPDTGHVFHVETMYACYFEAYKKQKGLFVEPEVHCGRFMRMCYQNWYTTINGKTYRGVMSARIKMNPHWTYCPFAVGPWSDVSYIEYRPRSPHFSCSYYSVSDWWDLNCDKVIGERHETDWYYAWQAQEDHIKLWF